MQLTNQPTDTLIAKVTIAKKERRHFQFLISIIIRKVILLDLMIFKRIEAFADNCDLHFS